MYQFSLKHADKQARKHTRTNSHTCAHTHIYTHTLPHSLNTCSKICQTINCVFFFIFFVYIFSWKYCIDLIKNTTKQQHTHNIEKNLRNFFLLSHFIVGIISLVVFLFTIVLPLLFNMKLAFM